MAGPLIGRRVVVAGLAAAPLLVPQSAMATPVSPIVESPAGRFAGQFEESVGVFRGIRYGQSRRFSPPVPVPRSSEIVRAHDFGPSCPQAGRAGLVVDEQCLFLNVWQPTGAARPGARLTRSQAGSRPRAPSCL